MYKCTEYVMICVGSTNQSECVVCYESNNHILSVKHAKKHVQLAHEHTNTIITVQNRF